MINMVFAQAQAPQSVTAPLMSMLPMFGLILIVFYFIVYRPQQKEKKRREETIVAMKKGTKVVTAGGIHGIIASLKDDVVFVKVSGDVKLQINKSCVNVVE